MKDHWEDAADPLAALAAGDGTLFEAFVRAELESFLGFFQRLGATRAEAEDLAQDLCLKLHQHAQQYDRQGRFAAYAFRVARNLWIDRTRRRAVRRAEALGPREEGEAGQVERLADRTQSEPGSVLARREEAERLREALGLLPERQRLVFELGVMQELPYREIGEILEIPVGTVKSRMFHAVRRLREAMGIEETGEGGEVA